MHWHFVPTFQSREAASLLVIPFWKKEGGVECAAKELASYVKQWNSILDLGDFAGKEKELSILYNDQDKEPRVLLLGLGLSSKASLESLRKSYAEVIKYALSKNCQTLNIAAADHVELNATEILQAILETVGMTYYGFDYQTASDRKTLIENITFITSCERPENVKEEVSALVKGMNLAKDLVNQNADEITPERLAQEAKNLEKSFDTIKVQVFDKEEIQKKGMGLFFAVSRASSVDPRFIIIEYLGHEKDQKPVVLIGKGITYDTGGLSLKPTSSMETMKCDMAGAGSVLGAILTAASLKLKVNLIGIIAATENSIGSAAYKLGDVYKAYNGTTVEILNTDAEGRLALADSLSYAISHYQPQVMIDLATLTGAAEVALGDFRCPLFSNHDQLAKDLFQAGEEVSERCWKMPLDPDYRELITSKIADIKNSGSREGSLIFSAMFLKEFVKEIPWAHFDIAGTAYISKPRDYHRTLATGFGVRLLIHYLKKFHGA